MLVLALFVVIYVIGKIHAKREAQKVKEEILEHINILKIELKNFKEKYPWHL
jgi:hypothetical protein